MYDFLCSNLESTMKEFPQDKVILTGNPCGESAISMKKANKLDYQLTPSKKLVLIVMGSLGSKTINEKIISFIDYKSVTDNQLCSDQ